MRRHVGERGATLLELMLGLTVTGMIVCGVVGLIFQEYSGTANAKTRITAAHEIGNAARILTQDAAMAAGTDLVVGTQPRDYITLDRIEREDFVDLPHSCSYWLDGDELRRDYDGTVTTVARNISSVKFSQTGRLLTVSICCTPRWWIIEDTIEKTYHIYLRPTEES